MSGIIALRQLPFMQRIYGVLSKNRYSVAERFYINNIKSIHYII
jgi:hypothetical protein